MKKDPYSEISKKDINPSKQKMEHTNDAEMWNRLKKIDDAARKQVTVKPKYGVPPKRK